MLSQWPMTRATGIGTIWKNGPLVDGRTYIPTPVVQVHTPCSKQADQRNGRTPLTTTRVHAPNQQGEIDTPRSPPHLLLPYYTWLVDTSRYSSTPAPVRRLLPSAEQCEQPGGDFN
ncbi:hypothetical protein JMJ78_0000947 [Colletotrichum scovillei]|nr:hypothetical protein JMJ78_0000947 [Colletotrichum scovillei]